VEEKQFKRIYKTKDKEFISFLTLHQPNEEIGIFCKKLAMDKLTQD